ncbi:hypothetical protein LCGC14_0338140 [marine sediment metagenome]|uniref:Uncharacterized protein n=1 Tax=marine sediment metagenome TaxID=412755 RepID=A0A0F9TEG4_9ZZZZ
MTITLKDIERAEQILEAHRSGDMESLSANDIQFVRQLMLPAMLKLVREMYSVIKEVAWHKNLALDHAKDCKCCGCVARRLVKRMEGEPTP